MNNESELSAQDAVYYLHIKRLTACLDEFASIEGVDADACNALTKKLASHTFNILVVGQFNRGKTTLINALIGEAPLPMGVIPLTSVVTVLSFGEIPVIKVCFQDGHCVETTPEFLGEYVTERGNPHNVKGVQEVDVSYPSLWLRGGVCLVDTPGIGSVYQHNTEVAYRFLPKADAVLFLLSADQPVSQAECDLLRDVREYANRIFFLLNKADHLSVDELQDAISFATMTIAEALGQEPLIFPASARQALNGKLTGSREQIEISRLPLFFTALNNFLVKDKSEVLIDSISRNLQRLISQTCLSIELAQKSLAAPLAELEDKIRAFDVKKREVEAARNEYGVILAAEAKRLEQQVEEELTSFKTDLQKRISATVETVYRENSAMSSRALSAHLEQYVTKTIRDEFDAWRTVEEEKMAGEFDRLCARFSSRINETVDDLLRFSADLFAIPFAAIRAESLRNSMSGFYYKFWSEPGSMKLFTSSLLLALPKVLGDSMLVKKMQEYAVDCVEVQSGRLRYDFAQRLEKGVRAFNREMMAKLDVTAGGIESAMAKGMELQRGNEQEAEMSRKDISARLGHLCEISEELGRISDELSANDNIAAPMYSS